MKQNSKLFTKITGTGTPVVFLHGFLEDHTIWNPIYPELVNSGFQCILIDLPCHGSSRFEGEICSMQFMAEMVFDVLNDHQIKDPYVIGHSMGGYVGLRLMKLMPLKLILLHSNFWADSDTKKFDRNRVIEVIKSNKRRFLSEAIPNLFAASNREFRREDIEGLIEKASRIPANEMAAATAGMRDREASYGLMNSGIISMIHGSDDPVIPTAVLEQELDKLLQKPRVYTISDCGHMAFMEQSEQLINLLRTILIE